MRRLALLAALSLAACSHAKAKGPAWPEPSKTADDGGESLAPHEASTATASIEKSDDSTPDADDKPAAVSAPAAAPEEKPATMSQPTAPANDDVIMSDEIIIEIDD